MLKIWIFLFLAFNLYGNDFVEIYRNQGLTKVQKILEDKLKDENYWKEYLKNKDVGFGYYETKNYILVTQKDQAEISLYKNENNKLELLTKNSVIVGEKEGDKQTEGDKRTPIGVYDLTEKKTNVDQFYGPFAIVTSYPNLFDKTQDKNGSGIWIHGMPLNEDRELFTRGCIALDNPQLEELDSKIELDKSILLTSAGTFEQTNNEELSKVLAMIYQWRDAWKYSDIENYLSFYASDFKRFDGMKIDEFKRYKKRIFNKKEKKKIKLYNIDISPYPNALNKKMFKVIMDEDYISPTVKFFGKKEIYVELLNNEVKILTEG